MKELIEKYLQCGCTRDRYHEVSVFLQKLLESDDFNSEIYKKIITDMMQEKINEYKN